MDIEAVNARVDKMGQWAKGIEARLKEVEALRQNAAIDAGDEYGFLAREIDALAELVKSAPEQMRTLSINVAAAKESLADAQATLETVDADLYLGVEGKNADERQARLALARKISPDYQAAARAAREARVSVSALTAEFTAVEQGYKSNHALLRGCVARVENCTMRLNKEVKTND